MNRVYNYIVSVACGLLVVASSCNNDGGKGNHAPIVLGDSSSIVTEKNDQYLQDHVTDIKAPEPKSENDTPAPPPAHDTIRQTPAAAPTVAATQPAASAPEPIAQNINGLSVVFSDVAISFPGINAKSATRNQNLAKANGATYQLVSGNLNGNHLVIAGGSSVKVSQRYETILMLKDEDASLPLETLKNTTDWESIPGKSNNYTITGLMPSKLEAPDFTPVSLRKAITTAARRHRISHKDEQEWIATVRNIRQAPHKPLLVALRSVIWKIDGKNAKGKVFSKQVRIDLPVL